jgi:hypothetical protein
VRCLGCADLAHRLHRVVSGPGKRFPCAYRVCNALILGGRPA